MCINDTRFRSFTNANVTATSLRQRRLDAQLRARLRQAKKNPGGKPGSLAAHPAGPCAGASGRVPICVGKYSKSPRAALSGRYAIRKVRAGRRGSSVATIGTSAHHALIHVNGTGPVRRVRISTTSRRSTRGPPCRCLRPTKETSRSARRHGADRLRRGCT